MMHFIIPNELLLGYSLKELQYEKETAIQKGLSAMPGIRVSAGSHSASTLTQKPEFGKSRPALGCPKHLFP